MPADDKTNNNTKPADNKTNNNTVPADDKTNNDTKVDPKTDEGEKTKL